jgi:hypothetical protein
MEIAMKLKILIAMAVAGAFASALATPASADDDKATPGTKSEKASGSPASGRSGGADALFERLDKNKDGFVTRDEARDATELQGRFAEMDKDNDGKLSRSEMRGLDRDRRGAAGSSK